MASHQHDAVFREEDIDDDDDESEEYEEDDDVLPDDEENDPSPSASAALAVTVAVPSSAVSNGAPAPISAPSATTIVVADPSDPKRRRLEAPIEEKKPALDDSRRLFQRLWTDEDEIELLQGFLDYTSQRGSSSHHNDTALFYDQIKSKLQLDFNKNQLVEKIRRLKKKYRNVLNKIGSGKDFSFKSAHDQATFEISRKIWSNVAPIADNSLDDDELNPTPNPNPNPNPNLNFSPVLLKNDMIVRHSAEKKTSKRSRPRSAPKIEPNDGSAPNRDHNCIGNATPTATPTATANATATAANNNCNSGGYSNNNIPALIEETVKSCLTPVLKELMGGAMGGPFGARAFPFNMNPLPLMNLGFGGAELVDEKWRKQHILELEVYSKRLELVQDQIKAAMEELRSGSHTL